MDNRSIGFKEQMLPTPLTPACQAEYLADGAGHRRRNKHLHLARLHRRAKADEFLPGLGHHDGFLPLVIHLEARLLERHLNTWPEGKPPPPTHRANSGKHRPFATPQSDLPTPKQQECDERTQDDRAQQKRQPKQRLVQIKMPVLELRAVNAGQRKAAPERREWDQEYQGARYPVIADRGDRKSTRLNSSHLGI